MYDYNQQFQFDITINITFRYLDDTFNVAFNNDDFRMYTNEIYPELTLNEANTNNVHCPFLNLYINIFIGKLNIKIYDEI